jgi:hypothetical protein
MTILVATTLFVADADSPVDFNAVRENARKEGIALSEIVIIYKNLTPQEKHELAEFNLITSDTGDTVLGRFSETGEARCDSKAVGVYYLAA